MKFKTKLQAAKELVDSYEKRAVRATADMVRHFKKARYEPVEEKEELKPTLKAEQIKRMRGIIKEGKAVLRYWPLVGEVPVSAGPEPYNLGKEDLVNWSTKELIKADTLMEECLEDVEKSNYKPAYILKNVQEIFEKYCRKEKVPKEIQKKVYAAIGKRAVRYAEKLLIVPEISLRPEFENSLTYNESGLWRAQANRELVSRRVENSKELLKIAKKVEKYIKEK